MPKKTRIHDPFWEREKEKYGRPIPSREYILAYLESTGAPVTHKKLVHYLKLKQPEELEALRRRLQAMERDGQLMVNRRGNYCLINKLDLISGQIESHPDGYGFLIPFDGSEDLYLAPRQMRSVLHGDHVLAREIESVKKRRREGIVVELCERTTKTLVGRLMQQSSVMFILPENARITQHIVIPAGEQGAAKSGQIIVAEMLPQTDFRQPLLGRVIEVLGEPMGPGMEVDIAVRAHQLPYEWSDDLLAVVKSLRKKVLVKEMKGRRDLRTLPFVTIDGEDAKDFDDAVFCAQENEQWKLYVAIADVSHYVKPQDLLDQSAFLRGNSVYFPNKVIPMLPEALSTELCSLKPQVDRLCMTCELTINAAGELQDYLFYESVIHSTARLTYNEVQAMLDGDKKLSSKHRSWLPHLKNLYQVFRCLQRAREVRGAIDFEMTETRIVFDNKQKIQKIVPVCRTDAHRLIEECMLITNVAAARLLEKSGIPGLYRVHTKPSAAKLSDVREFLAEFGLHLHGGHDPSAADYAKLLRQIKDRPDANLIQTVLLRSLTQAMYLPKNDGHFGLAFDAYAHFTSPIRRYPDLIVHRAIRHLIQHKKPAGFPYNMERMQQIGEHCSMTERRADEATRDVVDWLKCEYMQDRVDEEFDGVVTGVTAFGLFVTLKAVYVEGLVHVTALKNDYYHYDALRHRLQGERTRAAYRLGDSLRVRVIRVSLEDKKIDFELA